MRTVKDFCYHDGQIWAALDKLFIMIIKEMMTVSYATFYNDERKQIGVGAMAIRHLVNCVRCPGEPQYVLFSEEQAITRETPEVQEKYEFIPKGIIDKELS